MKVDKQLINILEIILKALEESNIKDDLEVHLEDDTTDSGMIVVKIKKKNESSDFSLEDLFKKFKEAEEELHNRKYYIPYYPFEKIYPKWDWISPPFYFEYDFTTGTNSSFSLIDKQTTKGNWDDKLTFEKKG